MKSILTLAALFCCGFFCNGQSELPDTLYYKSGVKEPCKIRNVFSWEVTADVNDTTEDLHYKVVEKKLLDSAYLSHPSLFLSETKTPKVGTNLIVSGVMSLVGTIAGIVGSVTDNLEAGLIAAGISQLVSTAALINAGGVSNAQEPPPVENNLQHVIVFWF